MGVLRWRCSMQLHCALPRGLAGTSGHLAVGVFLAASFSKHPPCHQPVPTCSIVLARCFPSSNRTSSLHCEPVCRFKVERYMQLVFGLAAALLFVPVMYHQSAPRTTQTAEK